MAVCAVVRAVAAERSLRARSCALAGATKAQARPMPARRYNTKDIVKSSLRDRDRSHQRRRSAGEPSLFRAICMGLCQEFPVRAFGVVSAIGITGTRAQ